MVDTDIDSPLESVIQTLQTSCNEVSIATTLVYIEENADKLIVSMEGLFEILTALQSIVDFTVRRTGESSDPVVNDTMKAHALSTYTSLVIQFGEWSFPIRTNFIKALVEMVCRRSIKKRDYVNSYLRLTACECLKELELSFQGEVTMCLKLGPWLENPLSPTPPIVEAVQEEQLACFENYARLFLTCCCESNQSSVHPKAVMKIVSLTLDAIETCSPWFRLEIARRLSSAAFIRESEDSSSLWTWAVVHHHFSRLLDSADPHQVHAFWMAAKSFVFEWEREFSDRLVGRIYDFVADPATPIPVKQICVYWLCEMLNDYYLQYSVYQRKDRLLVGRSAAPHALVEVELQAVLRYCEAFRAIPKSIINCVSADYLDSPNKVGVAFRFVTRVLMSFSLTEESSMFGIPQFLNELLASTARLNMYMPSVISLLSILSKSSSAPPHVLMRMLQSVGEFVCGVQPPSKTLVYFPLLAFFACETRSDPQVVISALSRFLVATEDISWSDGLRVLELVRLLALTHIDSHAKLAELLGLIKKSVTHVDIQDRASMYSRFLRDSGVDRSRFLSCNHKPAVLEMKPSGCSSTKSCVRRAPSVTEVMTSRILFERNLRPRKDLGILDNNWAVFDDRSKLVLPFTLRFNTQIMVDSDFPSKLYGIELSFSRSESFQPFLPVELPFLTCGEGESFPFMYEISLELIPVEPQPAVFDVQVIFTDQEGVCHKGTLEPFRVAFEDLFMPLPSPQSEWPTLWNSIWRDPFSKLLSLPRDKVANQIRATLSHFVVPSDLLSQLGKVPEFDFQHELLLHGVAESDFPLLEEEAIIIFIPPSCHLMMRFVMGKHTCVVWIATDRTELLLLLDEFFASWSAPTITDRAISA